MEKAIEKALPVSNLPITFSQAMISALSLTVQQRSIMLLGMHIL